MSLRLYGTISGCGKAAGVVIPSLGSGRYAPGPNIVSPSWLEGEDPNYTINTGWEQPGILAIVSGISRGRQPQALYGSPIAPLIHAQRVARFDHYLARNCLPPKKLRRDIQ